MCKKFQHQITIVRQLPLKTADTVNPSHILLCRRFIEVFLRQVCSIQPESRNVNFPASGICRKYRYRNGLRASSFDGEDMVATFEKARINVLISLPIVLPLPEAPIPQTRRSPATGILLSSSEAGKAVLPHFPNALSAPFFRFLNGIPIFQHVSHLIFPSHSCSSF